MKPANWCYLLTNQYALSSKVGSWGDKSKNSWMSWSEHKTIFDLIYVNFFDKICTLNIIYMSYRWKIGKKFAQKMIINTKTDKTSCQGYQKNKESKVVKWLQIYLPSIKTTLINHFFLIGTDPLWFQCNEFIRNIIVDWFFSYKSHVSCCRDFVVIWLFFCLLNNIKNKTIIVLLHLQSFLVLQNT